MWAQASGSAKDAKVQAMAKANTDLFYKSSKNRGVVPCEEWDYFITHELKSVTVRLLGPPIRIPDERYAIHCFDRSDGKLKVLEGPHELFEQFAVYAQKSGYSTSGPEAPDFRVALAARPFRYFVTPLGLTTLTHAQQVEMVCSCLNLGRIYKVGQDMHIVKVTMRLGVWPKPVWPTKYQEAANAADPERLAADGVIIRFPCQSELA
jgi:hypothetical protein